MRAGRLNVRSSRRSVSNDKRWLSDMNKVKGSPAIMYSSVKCDSDQHEPMVRPEVQRQQRLDLQRQQRQSQQQQREQRQSLSGGRDFTDILNSTLLS